MPFRVILLFQWNKPTQSQAKATPVAVHLGRLSFSFSQSIVQGLSYESLISGWAVTSIVPSMTPLLSTPVHLSSPHRLMSTVLQWKFRSRIRDDPSKSISRATLVLVIFKATLCMPAFWSRCRCLSQYDWWVMWAFVSMPNPVDKSYLYTSNWHWWLSLTIGLAFSVGISKTVTSTSSPFSDGLTSLAPLGRYGCNDSYPSRQQPGRQATLLYRLSLNLGLPLMQCSLAVEQQP